MEELGDSGDEVTTDGGGSAQCGREGLSDRLARLAVAPVDDESVLTVRQVQPASLSEQQAVDFLALCARVEAHVAAASAEAIAVLAGRGSQPAAFTEIEVAVALRLPTGAAVDEVHRAHHLVRALPATRAAMRAGDLLPRQARRLIDGTDRLRDRELCHRIEERVLPRAVHQSPQQVGRAVARALTVLDPDAFEQSHRDARSCAEVTFAPADHAMSYLTAYLPVVDGAALMQRIESAARRAKACGDDRSLGELRVDALVSLSVGHAGRGGAGDRASTAHGRPIEIGLVATVETMLGLAETPGDLLGFGPVPAATVRELARTATLRWLTIDNRTGRLLDHAVTSRRRSVSAATDTSDYRVPAALAGQVAATWVTSAAPGSSIPAARCDLDHLRPHPRGPTALSNLAPLDRRWHRAKTLAGVTVTTLADGSLRWRTPLGQTVDVTPWDYRLTTEPPAG